MIRQVVGQVVDTRQEGVWRAARVDFVKWLPNSKEALMDLSNLTARKRLIAEQAVETLRAFDPRCGAARAGAGVHGVVHP